MSYSQIRNYIESKKSGIVSVLKRLAAVPSVRSSAFDGAPFGAECRIALEKTAEIYSEYGFDSRLSGSGYLLSHSGNGDKTIGIFAHADVVPADEGWIFTEPFVPIEQNGFLIGRGVNDNKAGITMSLFAADTIRSLGIPLKSRLMMVTGSNEESGMADIAAFINENPMPDVSIVPDAGFPVYRGEKGILRFWARSRNKLSFIRDFRGGDAFNIILGKAEAELPYSDEILLELKKVSGNYNSLAFCRNDEVISVKSVGVAKHASSPEGSVNAAYIMIKALLECTFLPETDRVQLQFIRSLLDDSYGNGFGISESDPDFGRTSAVNGIVRVREGKLCMGFDVRFVNKDSEAMTYNILHLLDGNGFDMEIIRNSKGYKIPLDDKMLGTLLKAYSECTGAADPRPQLSSGGTYSRCLRNSYSIGTCVGNPIPKDYPAGHGAAHQPDESINISGHLDAIAILTQMIIAADGQL